MNKTTCGSKQPHSRLIAFLCVLLLSVSGAWAADFNVGAPTGNPVTDTANINAALANALADSGPNRVIFQSGGKYVLSATLSISGSVKNVTFTTDGAGKATIVGPNYMARPGTWDGVFTLIGLTNSSVGWDNIILLPPPFSTLGVSPFVAGSNTMGIGVHPNCATTTINMVNMIIAANNNADQPISTDGTVDPLTVTNYTTFGDAGLNAPYDAALINPGGTGNRYYLKNLVATGFQNQGFWTGGVLFGVTRGSQADSLVAENCIFSYSMAAQGFVADGVTNLRMDNCHSFNNVTDCIYVEDGVTALFKNCSVSRAGHQGAAAQGLQTLRVAHVTVDGCLAKDCFGADGAIGMDISHNDARFTDPSNSSFTMRNSVCDNNEYGILTRLTHWTVVEDCTFTNNDRNGYLERNAPAVVGDSTTTMRRCVFLNNQHQNRFPYAGTGNTTDFRLDLVLYSDFQVVEDVFISSAGSNGTRGTTLFRHPVNFHARRLVTVNSNQSGIWITDNPDGTTNPALAALMGATVEDCYVLNCGLNNNSNFGVVPLETTTAVREWAPINYFRGQNFWCINTVVENAISDAVFMSFTANRSNTAKVWVQDCTFINCNNSLIALEADSDNSIQATIRGVYAIGIPANQRNGDRNAIDIAAPNVSISGLYLSNQTGSAIVNSYVGAVTGTQAYDNLHLTNIGSNAIEVGQTWRGRTHVTNSVIRDVTNGSGISLGSGVENLLSNVEVTNAARYGVTIGEDGINPQTPMNVTSLDRLCLFNNGIAGIRLLQGDNTFPPMTLTNSTIAGNPAGIVYEHLFGQVLHVTDTIIAGDNPGGVGVSVPGQVVSVPLGIPAPRVQLWTSALVQDGTWGLTTPVQVDPSNPGNTVVLTGVISGNPYFKNETPGHPDFLVVTAVSYAGAATGVGPGQTGDLDGWSRYEQNPLDVAYWRRF
ncbi:right-handed parallel beta-helix repeat-containing protein [bacterium]|nr:right-handed parallel beta-helix repeat-containing protein [bacterium]